MSLVTRLGHCPIQSSIISGFIFAFIISFSDINYQSGVVHCRAQQHDVARHIFNLLLFEGNPSVAAASTMQILIVGLLIWLVCNIYFGHAPWRDACVQGKRGRAADALCQQLRMHA
jgi:hypothetical protein